MRILFVVLTLGSLLFVAQKPAAAESSAQMTVHAGFDGIGKIGGWMPIEVEVRNEGPDINGEIQIIVTDTTVSRGTYTRAPTLYTTPAVLPKRSHKRLTIEAELRASGQQIQARLVEGSTVISEQQVQLTRVAAGDLLCGVLSRNGPAFDFLPSIDLPAPLRRARIAHLEVTDLPNRPQLLASLDCLIFDNISTGSMLQGQKDALSAWVSSGGLLVVIGGPTWQRTVNSIPAELLPVKVTGLTSLDDIGALGEFGRQPITEAGPWLVSQSTITDGNPVVEQNGVPLLAAARRGSGTVIYMAVDPTTEPLRSWAGTPRLWRYVLAHGAGGVGLSSSVSASFGGWGRIPRNALVDISALHTASPGWLIIALALYGVVVGPLNYMFVRRIGQPAWSIVTIPLITAVAAIGTFTAASAMRESDVVMNKVSLVRGSKEAPPFGRTYVSVLSRQPATYDVRASETSLITGLFFPFPRDPSAEGQNWSLRVVGGPSPAVNELQLPGGTLGTFVIDSQAPITGRLDSDLRVEGRQLVGTITNGLGMPLHDATLILDYQVTRVGDLKVGETREVAINLANTATAGYGPPTSFSSLLYPSSNGSRRLADAGRRDVLDSVFGSGFNFNRLELHGPAIMGWLDTSAVDLEVANLQPAILESTLFVSSLPVGLSKGYEGELPASTVSRRQLGAATLNRQQFGSYDLGTGESIALQFSLPVSNGRFLLDGLYVNVDGRFRGVTGNGPPLGEVSLYNWRTGEWEDRIINFGRNLVKEASPFVSAAGDVRVRFTFKPTPDSGVTGVSLSRFDVTASGLMR